MSLLDPDDFSFCNRCVKNFNLCSLCPVKKMYGGWLNFDIISKSVKFGMQLNDDRPKIY
jgi:predicted P-loop ATPase/GTPase